MQSEHFAPKPEPSGESRPSGSQLNFRICPSCNSTKWKVYLNPENGRWICFKCNAKGVASGYSQTLTGVLDRLFPVSSAYKTPEEIQLPEWEPLTKMARKYLSKRGVKDPNTFGIVSLADSPRVLIPYLGPYGRIIYWTTRAYMDDGKPKYLCAPGKHPLYVLPGWTRWEDEVLIVEGVFDAIAYFEATGRPVVAIGGKTLPSYLVPSIDYLCAGDRRVMLDSDALAYSVRLARLLGGKVQTLPAGEDPGSYFTKGGQL